MTIQIDKNVPLPESPRRGRNAIYPWRELGVGDSFFVADPRDSGVLRNLVCITGKRLNRKFTCRKEPGGFRVWRVV